MKKLISIGVWLSLLVACAGRRAKVAPDLARSQKLADALQTGIMAMRPVPSTLALQYSPDAAHAGEAGAAIVGFVVMPNGRVDRDSRTLLYIEGHQIFAKNVCDALLAAKYEPPPTDRRGRVGLFPVFFFMTQGNPRDSARVRFDNASRAIGARLRQMSYDDALAWFQLRPACSKIKIGVEPLYGGPP